MNFLTFSTLLLIFSTTVRAVLEDFDDDENLEPEHEDFQTVDINAPEINELAQKLVSRQFATDLDNSCPQIVNQILKAQIKVDDGQVITMELEICPDVCNDGIIRVTECKVCSLEAWEKSSEDLPQITKFDCLNLK